MGGYRIGIAWFRKQTGSRYLKGSDRAGTGIGNESWAFSQLISSGASGNKFVAHQGHQKSR